MSDPYQIWDAAGKGEAIKKTLRTIWPELAECLDRAAAPGPEVEKQPMCRSCRERLAIGKAGEIPLCGLCVGKSEFVGMQRTRVAGWRSGPKGG